MCGGGGVHWRAIGLLFLMGPPMLALLGHLLADGATSPEKNRHISSLGDSILAAKQ